MSAPMLNVWCADFGNIALPDDFPTSSLTNSGWFDKRYKVYSDARRYIAEQDAKLAAGVEKSGFRAPSFTEWRQQNIEGPNA